GVRPFRVGNALAIVVLEDFTLHGVSIILILGVEDDQAALLSLRREPLGRILLGPRRPTEFIQRLDDMHVVLELVRDQVPIVVQVVITRPKPMTLTAVR